MKNKYNTDTLIPMVDYVLAENSKLKYNSEEIKEIQSFWNVIRYAEFLKQKPTLGMFIPCDKEGKPLKEPKRYNQYKSYGDFGLIRGAELTQCKTYKKAQDKVIFKGFELINYIDNTPVVGMYLDEERTFGKCLIIFWHEKDSGFFLSNGIYTIEDLTKYNLKLK